MLFEGEYRFTKEMVIDFFEIDLSTLNRYLANYEEELKHNGYILSKGKQLKEFKLQFGHLINKTTKTTALGLFNLRTKKPVNLPVYGPCVVLPGLEPGLS